MPTEGRPKRESVQTRSSNSSGQTRMTRQDRQNGLHAVSDESCQPGSRSLAAQATDLPCSQESQESTGWMGQHTPAIRPKTVETSAATKAGVTLPEMRPKKSEASGAKRPRDPRSATPAASAGTRHSVAQGGSRPTLTLRPEGMILKPLRSRLVLRAHSYQQLDLQRFPAPSSPLPHASRKVLAHSLPAVLLRCGPRTSSTVARTLLTTLITILGLSRTRHSPIATTNSLSQALREAFKRAECAHMIKVFCAICRFTPYAPLGFRTFSLGNLHHVHDNCSCMCTVWGSILCLRTM